jgi:ATP-binding protein involved in chromosome partitioning
MPGLTKSDLVNILKKIDGIDANHLTLNSVKSIESSANELSAEIVLSGESNSSLEEKIADAIKENHPELKEIHLNIQSKTPVVSTHKDPKKDSVLPGVKNTIAVASGKGGVGKSTVAVNLSVALAKSGARVGLLDADIYGPSIPLMLGLTEKPKVQQTENGVKILPLEKYGIKVISIGLLVDDGAPVIWRGPMASGAIKQFMTDVEWEELDYLIFDLPPGTGDIQLTLVQTIPLTGGVIVTTPQEVSLIDARKALKMFQRVNVPVLGIVENMSYFIAPDTGKKYDLFGSGGGEKTSKELSVPFLGGIPIDPRIREGGDSGIPITQGIPESEHSKMIMKISENLAEQVDIRNSKSTGKIEISLGEDD